MKVLLTTLNAKYIHSSLALRCLQAYCMRDYDIRIKEYSINNHLLDILAEIYREQPDVLGFACYIWNIEMTLKLAGLVKKVLPNTKVVLGGPEVSYDAIHIMKEHNFVDYSIMGEGEVTLHRLLDCLQSNAEPVGISGLVFRAQNQVSSNGCPQVVADLDSIPFVYADRDMDDLKDKIIYYESSRGCPFSCQYCLSSATSGVRYYSIERVLNELKFFSRHNVKQVKFVDRTFNAVKSHYVPILKLLSTIDCTTNFHFEIAADLLDEEVLAIIEKAPGGRFQFEIGIQSTNKQTLSEINRCNHWAKIVNNVSRLRSFGNAHLHLDLIAGLPYEDMEQFAQSFNDVYQLQPDMLQLGFLKLLKGSGIRNKVQQHGYVYMDNAPYEVLSNKYISYREIRELKLLEDVFSQIYNSGRFGFTLPFLIKLSGENAFAFYRSLTAFWEARNLHLLAHSSKALVQYLFEFCQQQEKWQPFQHNIGELLKIDCLLHEKGTMRPEFLPWNGDKWGEQIADFWRNEKTVRKYIPAYTFTTWREVKKKYHIEVFATDVTNRHNIDNSGVVPILFSYVEPKVEYQKLSIEDFFDGGGTN